MNKLYLIRGKIEKCYQVAFVALLADSSDEALDRADKALECYGGHVVDKEIIDYGAADSFVRHLEDVG